MTTFKICGLAGDPGEDDDDPPRGEFGATDGDGEEAAAADTTAETGKALIGILPKTVRPPATRGEKEEVKVSK